jgi:hypothetical protein
MDMNTIIAKVRSQEHHIAWLQRRAGGIEIDAICAILEVL